MYLLYFLLWVIFNGNLTVEIVLFGLVIAGLMFAFTCKFMNYSLHKEKLFWTKAWRILRYIWILVKEIVLANLSVIRVILSQEEEIMPVLVHFKADMKTSAGKALLANAITLTPGTITVLLEDQDYTVHCLDESLAPGIDKSVFVEMLTDIEQK